MGKGTLGELNLADIFMENLDTQKAMWEGQDGGKKGCKKKKSPIPQSSPRSDVSSRDHPQAPKATKCLNGQEGLPGLHVLLITAMGRGEKHPFFPLLLNPQAFYSQIQRTDSFFPPSIFLSLSSPILPPFPAPFLFKVNVCYVTTML